MAHNIEYYDYPENVNRDYAFRDLNNYVKHETWQEGGGGLYPIRWLETGISDSYEAAQDKISAFDRNNYDCLAVRYYEPKTEKSAKMNDLETKIVAARKLFNDRNGLLYPKTRTSEYIGCANCGSKLATAYLNANLCPVCHADLRPESMLKSIAVAKEKLSKAFKAKQEYISKHAKKEVRWLVKIEYHT